MRAEVTMTFFVHGDSDEELENEAKRFKRQLEYRYDCAKPPTAVIQSIEENNFGSEKRRKIDFD